VVAMEDNYICVARQSHFPLCYTWLTGVPEPHFYSRLVNVYGSEQGTCSVTERVTNLYLVYYYLRYSRRRLLELQTEPHQHRAELEDHGEGIMGKIG
jgi:hypothetical protein